MGIDGGRISRRANKSSSRPVQDNSEDPPQEKLRAVGGSSGLHVFSQLTQSNPTDQLMWSGSQSMHHGAIHGLQAFRTPCGVQCREYAGDQWRVGASGDDA